MTLGEYRDLHDAGTCAGKGQCPYCEGALDVALPSQQLAAAESPVVLHELQRVRAIFDTARAVSQTLEAQLMEALWTIRRELGGERQRFETLIGSNTDVDPKRAWLMAETWDSARRNRDLRTLASQQPSQAVALISQFIEGGLADRLESLSDNDHEVAAIVAQAPRKRTAAIRELIERGKAANEGRHPADRERIRELEAERDAAVSDLEQARKVLPHPGGEIRQALEDLRGVETSVAEVAERLGVFLRRANASTRTEAIQIAQLIANATDRIEACALEGWDEE